MAISQKLPEIGIVSYPGAQAASVLGMTDILIYADGCARKKLAGDRPLLRVSHWRMDAEEVPVRIFDTVPDAQESPTVLIIPPGLGDPIPREIASSYARWLCLQHAAGTCLSSICKGAFLLGETGLIAGRTVTTHWTYEEALLSRFPDARVNTDRLIIDDGDIITVGGMMAWLDLSLKFIDRYLGPVVMIETARTFLVDPPGREQSYYSAFSPRLNHGDMPILKVQHWLQTTGARETSLAILAAQAGLEQRTFIRRFRKATGLTTGDYIQRIRVAKAQELLQFTKTSIEQIAWDVAYTDQSAFRKVFGKIVGLTPGEYRQRFGT
ncbi:GlxA family transcriptional regulator [Pararhizobium sp. A13]|uniref:GlxA family transcriptional regulator n=1 Tax=Pararhizobium sp. A13 TaxID=3133975 RepID=UPI00311AF06D